MTRAYGQKRRWGRVIGAVCALVAAGAAAGALLGGWSRTAGSNELVLLCPASALEQMSPAALAAAVPAGVTVEAVPDEACTPAFIAERMKANPGTAALLPEAVTPADVTAAGARLFDMTGVAAGENLVVVTVARAAGAPDAVASAPADAALTLEGLPLCGTVAVLACHREAFSEIGCSLPESWSGLISDLLLFDSLGVPALACEPVDATSPSLYAVANALCSDAAGFAEDLLPTVEGVARGVLSSAQTYPDRAAALAAFARGETVMVICSSAEFRELSALCPDAEAVPLFGLNESLRCTYSPTYTLIAAAKADSAQVEALGRALLSGEAQNLLCGENLLPAAAVTTAATRDAIGARLAANPGWTNLSAAWRQTAPAWQTFLTSVASSAGLAPEEGGVTK